VSVAYFVYKGESCILFIQVNGASYLCMSKRCIKCLYRRRLHHECIWM